ncbi:DNA topoisomerase IB [Undibacterium sp. Di27W]|uniref:DNA topoisomerase IB n=1 Tax=Undibacterium sp. Di27W TaxID=3413036 RepID=UPI003BF11D29
MTSLTSANGRSTSSAIKSQQTVALIKSDVQFAAKKAGLSYVSDQTPGIRRLPIKRSGKTAFKYLNPQGKPVKNDQILSRIKSLAIPPAWTDVWICAQEDGHIQATARDARQRKQYRYHKNWRSIRDEAKYDNMLQFASALPLIREKVSHSLAMKGLPREKVIATVVSLIENTCMRIGNDEYARTNQSYGITTLRDKHVHLSGTQLQFDFRGKSGVQHAITLRAPRLCRIIKSMMDLPGQTVFQYLDEDGHPHAVNSTDVNDYIRSAANGDFTAKDFRTWAGTTFAVQALLEIGVAETQAEARKNLVEAISQVARKLGNTQAVCRKCYIHPQVAISYMQGTLAEEWRACSRAAKKAKAKLGEDEAILTRLLEKWQR